MLTLLETTNPETLCVDKACLSMHAHLSACCLRVLCSTLAICFSMYILE